MRIVVMGAASLLALNSHRTRMAKPNDSEKTKRQQAFVVESKRTGMIQEMRLGE